MENKGTTFFELSVAFLLGAIVGAGLALLFAPAPGVETRRRLAQYGEKITEQIQETAEKVKAQATEQLSKIKKKEKPEKA